MPKINRLVCICGFLGSGKSSAIKHLKELNFKVFNTDEFVHSVYKKDQIGYELIKKHFGNQFINEKEVNRIALKQLILSDISKKHLLEELMNEVIKNQIISFKQNLNNEIGFVELATYLFFKDYFEPLFDYVVYVKSSFNDSTKNDFYKYWKYAKVLAKNQANLNKKIEKNVFLVDEILLNDSSIENWFCSISTFAKNIQKKFVEQ